MMTPAKPIHPTHPEVPRALALELDETDEPASV
jgi:hypothetical protein